VIFFLTNYSTSENNLHIAWIHYNYLDWKEADFILSNRYICIWMTFIFYCVMKEAKVQPKIAQRALTEAIRGEN
jgi:hypothetical protein